MRVPTRIVAAALAAATAIALMSGCSAGTSSSSTHLTLTLWHQANEDPSFVSVYKRWQEKTGNKIKFVDLPVDTYQNAVTTKWATGDRPDILEYFGSSLFWALNPGKNMQDLSKMSFVKNGGGANGPGASSYHGKVYGAVTAFPELFGIFFNKQILADAGVDKLDSYADLEFACKAIQAADPGVAPLYEAGGTSWPTQLLGGIIYMAQYQKNQAYENSIIDKSAKMDDSDGPFLAGLKEYQKLQKMGCYNADATTATIDKGITDLVAGKAAMIALPSSFFTNINAASGGPAKTDAAIGWATPSATKNVATYAPNIHGLWYLPKTGDSAKEAAARDFIEYATGKDYQKFVDESKTFPVYGGFKDPADVQGILKEVKSSFDNGATLAFNTNLVGFNATFNTTLTGILSGQITPDDGAKSSQQQLEQGAKAAGIAGW